MPKTKPIRSLIQIAVSLTIAAVLVVHLNGREFFRSFRGVSWQTTAILLLLLTGGLLIRGYRWKYLFDKPPNRISLRDAMVLLLVGLGLNLALPASSGDIVKSYFGYKWSGVKERMISVSIVDKLLALAAVFVLGIPIALVYRQLTLAGMSILGFVPVLAVLLSPWWVRMVPRSQSLLNRLTRIVRQKLDVPAVMEEAKVPAVKILPALLYSLGGWLFTYGQLYVCFRAVRVEIPWYYVLSAAPLLTLLRLFPLTLSGIGSDEAGMCYLFGPLGAGFEQILAAAVLYRFFALILPGLAGLFFLAITKRLRYHQSP
ncbi:MAG: flippase-like domain-containing protein [Sedimentisphaerales bacterium]|nr:flippase-like domain-containing protein [Sedimentisphaerales bacterium]